MNWIQKLLCNKLDKQQKDIYMNREDYSPLYAHDRVFIEKIIELLKNKPDYFSAMGFNGKSLDSSIQSKDKNIVIMIESGHILRPLEIKMLQNEKEIIKQLILPIVERDSKYLIEKFICKGTKL